jgi:UDP-N-acetylmuramate--alanine ligase
MIKNSKIKRIHFVGIGGAGMSGIAEVLHNMGFTVSGSDLGENETVNRLRRMGIAVSIGHAAENVDQAETLVYSSAVSPENVEVTAMQARGLPVIPRAEMLAELMRMKYALAVAGTHGKTTTTSMLATLLGEAGLDPTYVVGGRLKAEESGAKLGQSDYLVAEADESDGSFLSLYPTLAVITNVEDDHLDHYGSFDNLRDAFVRFANKVPFYGAVMVNEACPVLSSLLPRINKQVRTFSIEGRSHFTARDLDVQMIGSSFNLIERGFDLGRITLNVGGLHNVSNALGAIAAAREIGLDFATIRQGLSKFYLPQRRFQVLYRRDDLMVVDDYAHHPTEIRATLSMMKKGGFKRVVAIFQPHRYTRLSRLMEEFARSFVDADRVVLAPVYKAGQEPIEGVNSETLGALIRKTIGKDVLVTGSLDELRSRVTMDLAPGDGMVFLSAGDLSRLAHTFARGVEGEAT